MTGIIAFERVSPLCRLLLVFFVLASCVLPSGAQQRIAPSVIDLVVLRVEFQPDTTRFTTGNGTFAGPLFEGVDAPSIDPLPHDASYFEAHLQFLENYIDHVSDGRTEVRSHLLPDVVQLSATMGTYAPTGQDSGSDEELTKLVTMVRDSWALADMRGFALPAGLNPSTTAFLLFHAGVGRDIELVGTSLDKTPEDLPSLFLGEEVLSRLGATSMSIGGIPISNTLVLPRTESRLGFNFLLDEPFLVELSTNGLLASSFLNYLGVPDLFNTKTGESAIGPFGVMDALGIFAFSGLFPPEPSAWTKLYLGWADLNHNPPLESEIELRASGLAGSNDVAKFSISDAEYFLVENRHRDPEGDGLNMRVWTPSGMQTVSFANADPEFNSQTISGFPGGVVVDVDNYDFALPGGIDENDNPLLGGALIWHVDQNRLNEGLVDNSVNADPEARAIDLEEADGAQDLGFSSNAGLFGPRFDLGTPFDFWYEGNPITVRTSSGRDIRLYENRFSDDTIPPSDANSGVGSIVNLKDFSLPGVTMTFVSGRSNAPTLTLVEERHGFSLSNEFAEGGLLAMGVPENVYWAFGATPGAEDGKLLASVESHGGGGGPLAYSRPAIGDFGAVSVFDFHFSLHTIEPGLTLSVPLPGIFSTPLSIYSPKIVHYENGDDIFFRVGAQADGQPVIAEATLHEDGSSDSRLIQMPGRVRDILLFERDSDRQLIFTDAGVFDENGLEILSNQIVDIPEYARIDGGITSSGWTAGWASRDRSEINLMTSDGILSFVRSGKNCEVTDPVFFDVNADNSPDVIFGCGPFLYAAHLTGALISSFPVPLTGKAISDPVAAVTPIGETMLFVSTKPGYLDGFIIPSAAGVASSIRGFPLPIGSFSAVPPHVSTERISTVSGTGTIRAWELPSEMARNASGLDVMAKGRTGGAGPIDNGNRLLVGSETYNWPNPIADGTTHIRFAVLELSDIKVTILDMAGGLVQELEMRAVAPNVPSEIIWESEAGSGIYLARVEARASSGRNDTRLIRMAIIR